MPASRSGSGGRPLRGRHGCARGGRPPGRRRLAAHPATVQHTDLAGLASPGRSFDKAFAVNVNVFWTGPAEAELDVLRRVLRPGGIVHLVYEGPPSGGGRDVAPSVAAALERVGCATGVARDPSGSLLCVTGTVP